MARAPLASAPPGSPRYEAVLVEQPVQVGAADSRLLRRQRHLSLRPGHRLLKVAPLELVDGPLPSLGEGGGGLRFVERQRLAQGHAALEEIAQLADVARPGRPEEARDEGGAL